MANPVWFDTAHYKAQKLAQLTATDTNGAWTPAKLDSVMESAGFAGDAGWFAHFTQYGAAEHCSPNATFNAAEYLTAKLAQLKAVDTVWGDKSVSDVQSAFKTAGIGEWEHYHKYGMAEGLSPSNAFDEMAYLGAKLAQLRATDPTNWTDKSTLDVRSALQTAELSALEHYMLFGKAEGIVVEEVPADKKVTVPSDFHIFGGQGGMPSAGIELTRGSDNLTGTAGNDSFFAAYASGFETLNVTDTLNGGAGEDTLYVGAEAGVRNFDKASIKGIEHVVSVDGGLLNISGNADVKDAVNKGSVTAKLAQGVTIKDVPSDSSNDIIVNFTDAAGNDDAVTVGLDSSFLDTFAVEGIEKLTLNVTNANTGGAFTDKALKELTVTGEGSVSLSDGSIGSTGSISNMDFSQNIGGAKVNLSVNNLTKDATVTGGIGDDGLMLTGDASKFDLTVDLGSGADILWLATGVHKDATYAGGEGADTLRLNNIDTSTEFGKQVTGFEQFILADGVEFSAGHFAKGSVTDVSIEASADVFVVNDFSAVNITGNTGALTSLTMNTTAVDLTFDNTSVEAASGASVADLIAANMTDLQITSVGNVITTDKTTANILTDVSGAGLVNVTIGGDQNIVLGANGAGTAGTWNATALKSVDASGLTGDLYLNMGAAAFVDAGKGSITGGDGNDTIILGSGDFVTVKGNAGDDIYNVKAAEIAIDPSGTTPSLSDKIVTIADFQKGDTLSLGKVGTAATKIDMGNMGGKDLNTYLVDLCKTAATTDDTITWVTLGQDSYIVRNSGATTATTDVIVKLTGITDITGLEITGDNNLTWA